MESVYNGKSGLIEGEESRHVGKLLFNFLHSTLLCMAYFYIPLNLMQ